jgi:cytoskeletal protein CcmA (bactofilin family)
MLRIGKNPSESEQPDKQEGAAYGTAAARTQTPTYQPVEPPAKPSSEGVGSSKALSESETLARDIKEGTLSGFVGSGTVVTGEANFKAMMRVDGQLSGRIHSSSGTLIIGANGKVDANIEVAVATIHGTVNGDIIASQRLELGRSAKVNGNIQTPSLVIEQGAVFEGSCKMTQVVAADKGKSSYKTHDDQLMKPLNVKDSGKASDITSISDVAS